VATGNFYSKSSVTYVIETDEWFDLDDWVIPGLKENKDFEEEDVKSMHELRSYPSTGLGCMWDSFTFLGLEFILQINIFVRSGYYSDCNLDYEIDWSGTLTECEYTIEEIIDTLEYDCDYFDIKPGILAIHKKRLIDKMIKLEETLEDKVDTLLRKVAVPYGVSARFSNGETFYEKVS